MVHGCIARGLYRHVLGLHGGDKGALQLLGMVWWRCGCCCCCGILGSAECTELVDWLHCSLACCCALGTLIRQHMCLHAVQHRVVSLDLWCSVCNSYGCDNTVRAEASGQCQWMSEQRSAVPLAHLLHNEHLAMPTQKQTSTNRTIR